MQIEPQGHFHQKVLRLQEVGNTCHSYELTPILLLDCHPSAPHRMGKQITQPHPHDKTLTRVVRLQHHTLAVPTWPYGSYE